MQNDSVETELVLSPYHPIVYNFVEANYPVVSNTETWLQDNVKHIVYGSFSPIKWGLDAKCFRDGMHLKDVFSNEIIKKPTNISADGL